MPPRYSNLCNTTGSKWKDDNCEDEFISLKNGTSYWLLALFLFLFINISSKYREKSQFSVSFQNDLQGGWFIKTMSVDLLITVWVEFPSHQDKYVL